MEDIVQATCIKNKQGNINVLPHTRYRDERVIKQCKFLCQMLQLARGYNVADTCTVIDSRWTLNNSGTFRLFRGGHFLLWLND